MWRLIKIEARARPTYLVYQTNPCLSTLASYRANKGAASKAEIGPVQNLSSGIEPDQLEIGSSFGSYFKYIGLDFEF